ncbi:unnamed protein product [Linum tenue]|uniref:Uncharacterized protein n=1 Tax=Linum tenue TaxID=586396 RepID=A0AAV0L821_9ROSI|nr:unnamed protein product [Linum tenue]
MARAGFVRIVTVLMIAVAVMIQVLGCGVESRPLNILKRPDAQSGGSWWADAAFWEGLALGAVKQSGPSPGVGNSFTNAANDGPSPGVGH